MVWHILLQASFFPSAIVKHKSLSNSKSPQVSRTLLNILVDLHYSEVRMVLFLSLISTTSSLFLSLLGTVPRAQNTIKITFTMFFRLSVKIQIFAYLFIFFYFYSVVGKIHKRIRSFFFLIHQKKIWSSDWDRGTLLYLKYQKIL